MRVLLSVTVAALALSVTGCGDDAANTSAPVSTAPLKQIAAPNGDWSQSVQETPEGGFRMGNPNAPVKLVEYGSIGCSHCAEFAETATEPLTSTYIKSGQVSWEFRPFLIFPTDPGATMLLKCQGPVPFFHLTDQLYQTQGEWAARAQSMSGEERQQLEALPPAQRAAAYVRAAGLDQFFRQRGMPESKINACLADGGALERIAATTALGTQEGVTGTPTFFINGRLVSMSSSEYWRELEPQLRAAIPG